MALRSFNMVHLCKPPVPVHDEGDVSRYWTLLGGVDEELAELEEDPFDWGAVHKPFPRAGSAQFGGHYGGVGGVLGCWKWCKGLKS